MTNFDDAWRAIEREEDQLHEQLERGEISQEEFRRRLRELRDAAGDLQREEERRGDFDARFEL